MQLEMTLNVLFLSLVNYIQYKIKMLREALCFSIISTPECLVVLLSSNELLHLYIKL